MVVKKEGKKLLVTIDGPAASGKTSVSREIANRLGWSWVSTGAFYRGTAFVALKTSVDLEDEDQLISIVENKNWDVCMSSDKTQFIYEDEDVTDQIYLEEIGSAASKISHHPRLRESLLQAQRDCLSKVDALVAEGRDCGTVVFPEAPVKIYLTAKSDHRAMRRAKEEGSNLEETLTAQKKRDKQDTSRIAAPLQIPEKAHIVDTSEMDLQQVVDHINSIIRTELNL